MVNSLAYFLLGYSLKDFNKRQEIDPRGAKLYCVIWGVMGFAITFQKLEISYPLVQLGSAVFLYFLARIICEFPVGRKLEVLGPITFFVYAVHEPAQTFISKILTSRIGVGGFLSFVITPLIVFVLAALAYRALRRIAPKLLSLATGAR